MGNFSRTTFDPAKRYAAVRLQQGVPLVDADWNELQDVTRNELYDALAIAMPNSLATAMVVSGVANNDILLGAGTAIVSGRPLRLAAPLRYSTQRYANPATAAADSVQVAAPLTTPVAARTDVVYLDVFEREVGSAEDGSIVNPAIGIETAVRVRREVVLRVAEGGSTIPPTPPGHTILFIANLNRAAGNAAITPAMIDDIAPRPRVLPFVEVAYAPVFAPATSAGSALAPWLTNFGAGSTVFAMKPANASAFGVLPLELPDGAHIRTLRYRGLNQGPGALGVVLRRSRFDNGVFEVVAFDTVAATGNFDRTIVVDQSTGLSLVDNATFSYHVTANASPTADAVTINGISLRYKA